MSSPETSGAVAYTCSHRMFGHDNAITPVRIPLGTQFFQRDMARSQEDRYLCGRAASAHSILRKAMRYSSQTRMNQITHAHFDSAMTPYFASDSDGFQVTRNISRRMAFIIHCTVCGADEHRQSKAMLSESTSSIRLPCSRSC